jgi:hypothetical protein
MMNRFLELRVQCSEAKRLNAELADFAVSLSANDRLWLQSATHVLASKLDDLDAFGVGVLRPPTQSASSCVPAPTTLSRSAAEHIVTRVAEITTCITSVHNAFVDASGSPESTSEDRDQLFRIVGECLGSVYLDFNAPVWHAYPDLVPDWMRAGREDEIA